MKSVVRKPLSGDSSSAFSLWPNSPMIPKSCQNNHQAKHPSLFKARVGPHVKQILPLPSPSCSRILESWPQYPSPAPRGLDTAGREPDQNQKNENPGESRHHALETQVQVKLLYFQSSLPTDTTVPALLSWMLLNRQWMWYMNFEFLWPHLVATDLKHSRRHKGLFTMWRGKWSHMGKDCPLIHGFFKSRFGFFSCC